MSMFCFKPFDIGKWFVAGFAAFLMQLQIDQDLIQQLANLSPGFQQWTINEPLAAAITFGLLALIINSGLAFLNARGLMILYDNIVKNKAQISRPWEEYAEQANSLFIASLIINVPFTMVAVVMGIGSVSLFNSPTSTSQGPALAFAVAALVLLFIALAIVNALLYLIVAPIMYARRLTVLDAWAYAKENVLPGNIGNFVLLLLAFIPLGIAALLAVIVLVFCTIASRSFPISVQSFFCLSQYSSRQSLCSSSRVVSQRWQSSIRIASKRSARTAGTTCAAACTAITARNVARPSVVSHPAYAARALSSKMMNHNCHPTSNKKTGRGSDLFLDSESFCRFVSSRLPEQ